MKPLNSQFKAIGSPLGYAFGLENQGDQLGFVSDYTPSDRQEDAWRIHYTEKMFDQVLSAAERDDFLYTHPISDTACYNVFRWTPSVDVQNKDVTRAANSNVPSPPPAQRDRGGEGRVRGLTLCGTLFSNLGNGVELRVIRWNDDTRYDVLGTFSTKNVTVGRCGTAEFVLRLAPGEVGRHIDFVLHNAGSHICDATALRILAYTNVPRAVAQTDVTEEVQARFHNRLVTPLGPYAELFGETSLEGLVRQITRYRATHSRILVYTLTPELLHAYKAGETPEYVEVSEQIADHYSIPSLNLAKYAADRIIAGEISFEDFSADGINPTDAGAKIYAEAVATFIDDLMTAYSVPEKPQRYVLPEPLFPETDDNGRIVAYEDPQVQRFGTWQPGQASPIGPFRHVLVSDEAGATLTLKFKGSEIGIIDVVDKDSADYEYSVDGAAFQKLSATKDVTNPTMRLISLIKGMDRKAEHQLVLKVASHGTARLGGFLLNGSVENASAGMNTPERIDSIYAAMDPIVYAPSADRFAHIPRTMSKLRDGGELRMVLLGDSIMGNTSASSFDLLLMRNYPKCKLIKIPSLRSSTGCTYYQDDNRVEHYVLRHKPDLLVIGGISNRGDAEAARSVIKQVRAQEPNTEVLLLTPVFGAIHDEHIRTFTREIDTTTDNFRYNMQRVATEEKCAFFDMTGPWWAYIQDSGKTYGWFMGDRVHANGRGCQIIGRLLETWFKE